MEDSLRVVTSPYGLALEATAVLMLWVGLSVWQRDRRAPAGLCFLGLTVAVLLWCVGDLLAHWGALQGGAQDRVAFLGILAVPPFWLAIAMHAAGIHLARRLPWFPVVLLAPSAVLYATFYLGPWSNLFVVSDGVAGQEGPLFGVWTAYAYAFTVAGVALFVLAATRWPRRGLWLRVAALAVGVTVPLLGNATYLFGGLGWDLDPTPILLGTAALPLRGAIFGAGLFDVLPVEQRNLLHGLPVAIVLADDALGVLELNPSAERRLGVARKQALGRSLEALVADLPPDTPIQVVTLGSRGNVRCAVIGDAVQPGSPGVGRAGPFSVATG